MSRQQHPHYNYPGHQQHQSQPPHQQSQQAQGQYQHQHQHQHQLPHPLQLQHQLQYVHSSHPEQNEPPIVDVTKNDVLSGRGVNMAKHEGNERFRTLVNSRYDPSYCTEFTSAMKKALAWEIINHIRSLDPPGRFLKRTGRSNSSRGLSGPWELLTDRECETKTCQALRDCNRPDREGYAAQVKIPEDVEKDLKRRKATGLSLKQHASVAASATVAAVKGNKTRGSATSSGRVSTPSNARLGEAQGMYRSPSIASAMSQSSRGSDAKREDMVTPNSYGKQIAPTPSPEKRGRSNSLQLEHREESPSVVQTTEWLKKQRLTPAGNSTPSSTQNSTTALYAENIYEVPIAPAPEQRYEPIAPAPEREYETSVAPSPQATPSNNAAHLGYAPLPISNVPAYPMSSPHLRQQRSHQHSGHPPYQFGDGPVAVSQSSSSGSPPIANNYAPNPHMTSAFYAPIIPSPYMQNTTQSPSDHTAFAVPPPFDAHLRHSGYQIPYHHHAHAPPSGYPHANYHAFQPVPSQQGMMHPPPMMSQQPNYHHAPSASSFFQQAYSPVSGLPARVSDGSEMPNTDETDGDPYNHRNSDMGSGGYNSNDPGNELAGNEGIDSGMSGNGSTFIPLIGPPTEHDDETEGLDDSDDANLLDFSTDGLQNEEPFGGFAEL